MSLVCGVCFYPLTRRRLLRYRYVTACALSILTSLGVFGEVALSAKNPRTAIVAPSSKPKPAPPLPPWVEKRYNEGERCPKWEPLFKEFKLPVKWFSYLSHRESRCRESAVNARWKNGKIVWTLNENGTFDSGILQINSGWISVTADICKSKRGDLSVLFEPRCNVAVARYLYDNGGLRHWRL